MTATISDQSAPALVSLFSFSGRASRSAFWRTFGAAWALLVLTLMILTVGMSMEPEWPIETMMIAMLVIYVPAAVAVASVIARRLHDLALSAHWLWLLAAAKLVPILLHASHAPQGQVILAGVVASVLITVAFLYLGFSAGTRGPNPYGADPLPITQ